MIANNVMVNGKTPLIQFEHYGHARRNTRCSMYLLEEGQSKPPEKAFLMAEASCSPSDQFDRAVGRLLAFSRLLRAMQSAVDNPRRPEFVLNQSVREGLAQWYVNTCKLPHAKRVKDNNTLAVLSINR